MRRPLLFLFFLALAVGAVFWVFPKLKKSMVGEKFLTRVELLSASLEQIPLADDKSMKQLNLVLALRITCPIGEKPESMDEFKIVDRKGQAVEVDWGNEKAWNDEFDKGTSTLEMKEVYVQPDFRKGTLKRGELELCALEVPEPMIGGAPQGAGKTDAKTPLQNKTR